MIVRRHGHRSPHTLTVLEGSFTCDGVECGPGTHIELPLGAAFGPFVAGPEGVHLYEVMLGDPRSWSDEPEAMDRALAEHGVVPLPDPPVELPAGLEDLRAMFSEPAGGLTRRWFSRPATRWARRRPRPRASGANGGRRGTWGPR